MKRFKLAVFIFRRDLRLHDNSALLAALAQAEMVLPCFIFDPRQLKHNAYRSDHCVQFMLGCLEDLAQQFQSLQKQLYYFQGEAETIIERLIREKSVDAVFVNRDYTPFSELRDQRIQEVCQRHRIEFKRYGDLLLTEPESVMKSDGKPYTVYTPFSKAARFIPVAQPIKNTYENYYHKVIAFANNSIPKTVLEKYSETILLNGGRTEAKKLLQRSVNLQNYAESRNFPVQKGTTLLSAHNKFGTVSIREVYSFFKREFGSGHTLFNELYWRDFFTHIAYHFPHVFGQPFHAKYAGLAWENNLQHFQRWCNGETGFPIVDAGMRQMNATGYMHNRVRMITASFLTKDLHIDWRWGEKYFAQTLLDYDPAVNNGNWQWAASTGCDAQPYFRIFNPWLQQEKFDPGCEYIKQWIAELRPFPAKSIHSLSQQSLPLTAKYPPPVVDHKQESLKTKVYFKECGHS